MEFEFEYFSAILKFKQTLEFRLRIKGKSKNMLIFIYACETLTQQFHFKKLQHFRKIKRIERENPQIFLME